MSEPILVERDDAVATVLLNNPEKLNAVTLPMWAGLRDAMRALNADRAVRCIVLKGAGGKAFAAGADIGEFQAIRSNAKQALAYDQVMRDALADVFNSPHPTVAAIRGACVGGGLELAMQCDFRLASEESRFGVPINRLGLAMAHPEVAGIARLAGAATALEILLEGRVFDAQEALQKRLLSKVVADDVFDDEVAGLVRRITGGAPLVNRWHKAFARRIEDPTPLSPDEEAEWYHFFDSSDYREGVDAFLNKRKPAFKGE